MEISILNKVNQEKEKIADLLREFPDTCVYCGMPSEVHDHLIPRAFYDRALRKFVPTVPACRRCNSVLGESLIFSISQRATHVAEIEKKKQWKLLNRQSWTEDKLSNVGRNLHDYVVSREVAQEILKFRLRNLRAGGIGAKEFRVMFKE